MLFLKCNYYLKIRVNRYRNYQFLKIIIFGNGSNKIVKYLTILLLQHNIDFIIMNHL